MVLSKAELISSLKNEVRLLLQHGHHGAHTGGGHQGWRFFAGYDDGDLGASGKGLEGDEF
jgi:hypothetical protein